MFRENCDRHKEAVLNLLTSREAYNICISNLKLFMKNFPQLVKNENFISDFINFEIQTFDTE